MVDIVTPNNETLYRNAFCIEQNHTMECVEETVTNMANMLSCVCNDNNKIPIQKFIKQIGLEQFQLHLITILEQKDCNCKIK